MRLLVGGVMCLAGLVTFSCSDKYDLDSEQPSNLNTIYGFMQDKGNFTNFLQLIDDLGEAEVLSKTGSKTLFVADDDAFAAFYASNDWGVKSYAELSSAQKKQLLYSAMIDNPYPTSMLSTAEGPVKGEVCRRMASLSLYDSVEVVSTSDEEIPQSTFWATLRQTHPEIVLFKDASGSQPMLHFTPKFISANKLESTDVDFLYNDPAGTRQSDDTYVNRAKILETQFCKNGFVHVVDRVITPLDNMSEIIRKNPSTKIFSSILERFAAPAYDRTLTENYNVNKGTDIDSVYIKKYFSDRSSGSGYTSSSRVAFAEDKDGNTFDASLKFDPGWNTFLPEIYNVRNGMMEDMAVMMVPNDAALTDWFDNGGGYVIKNYYGSLENTPSSVLAELINVNMLNSLVSSVPSKFNTILNDANLEMGVTSDAVDSVLLGCNGAVYVTNKVFAPASYSSVLFPAVIDTENLNIIKNAIDNLDYEAYLNSMVSTYSFYIPTNNGLLSYIDPTTYGSTTTEMWEFHYDATKSATQRIYADVYAVDTTTWEKTGERLRRIEGNITSTSGNGGLIHNRMLDILDNIIGVGAASADHRYVITKGKTYVQNGGTVNTAGSMTASGGFQMERNQPLTVDAVYNMENGEAYTIDGIIMGSRNSVADVLAENEDFSDFYNILMESGMIATSNTYGNLSASRNKGNSVRGNLVSPGTRNNVEVYYPLLNAFHYTVYAPTNEAMQIAYDAGLPTLDDLAAAQQYDAENEANDVDTDSADHIINIYRNFVKYHIQSNSIYVDGGFDAGQYETTKTRQDYYTDDDGNRVQDADGNWEVIVGSPYRLTINSVSSSGLTLTDELGNIINVDTSNGKYNLQAREYWLTSAGNMISNSSSAVVHAVDRPLFYSADQFIYLPTVPVEIESVKQRK